MLFFMASLYIITSLLYTKFITARYYEGTDFIDYLMGVLFFPIMIIHTIPDIIKERKNRKQLQTTKIHRDQFLLEAEKEVELLLNEWKG
jgi:hypothetical protein